jgi:hypothetical protein
MKKISQTEHLNIFGTEEFVSDGDFCTPRRLFVAFPREEAVCHNMRPLITALVARWDSLEEPGKIYRVFIDRLEIARDSGEDYLDPLGLVHEFVKVVLEGMETAYPDAEVVEEFSWREADPWNVLEQGDDGDDDDDGDDGDDGDVEPEPEPSSDPATAEV